MKHATHTPGPWKFRAHSVLAPNNSMVGSVSSKLNDEETKANARLIAAAPEMYELILDIACTNNFFSERAKELLAKARGEK